MRLAGNGITVRLGDKTVLENVATAVEGGEMLGLIGPNGAGKTTLLRVLACLLRPAAGAVVCDGRPLAGLAAGERARLIAYLAQGSTVYWPIVVEKLVGLGRLPHRASWREPTKADGDAVSRAMRATEVATLRGRTMATLSGGERMRVMLARALAVEAPILLADEPVAALDPYHQLHVMEVLQETATRGTAVIAVLHDLTLAARFCDRLLLLRDGAVLAEGRPDAVLTDANLAAAYAVSGIRGRHRGEAFFIAWDRCDPYDPGVPRRGVSDERIGRP